MIIANLWLHNGRITCSWIPHSSAPLSSCVFKWQENPRCIEPGICRVVWRRQLLLRERTGRENERENNSSVPRRSFQVSSLDQSRSQTLYPLPPLSLPQKGKTYCATFCASLALLAGSGNNKQWWKALHHCLLVFLFLADQIFYKSYVDRQHFRSGNNRAVTSMRQDDAIASSWVCPCFEETFNWEMIPGKNWIGWYKTSQSKVDELREEAF